MVFGQRLIVAVFALLSLIFAYLVVTASPGDSIDFHAFFVLVCIPTGVITLAVWLFGGLKK